MHHNMSSVRYWLLDVLYRTLYMLTFLWRRDYNNVMAQNTVTSWPVPLACDNVDLQGQCAPVPILLHLDVTT